MTKQRDSNEEIFLYIQMIKVKSENIRLFITSTLKILQLVLSPLLKRRPLCFCVALPLDLSSQKQ